MKTSKTAGSQTVRSLFSSKQIAVIKGQKSKPLMGLEHQTPGYAARVEQLENEGLTTSDAQGCADAEVMTGEYLNWQVTA